MCKKRKPKQKPTKHNCDDRGNNNILLMHKEHHVNHEPSSYWFLSKNTIAINSALPASIQTFLGPLWSCMISHMLL